MLVTDHPSQNRFVMGTAVTTGVPSVRNIVDRWYIDTGVTLPAGLTLNSQTGEISGIPTVTCDLTFFTISAENESGTTQAMLSIEVRKGRCIAEGRFPTIEVGQEAVIECSSLGDYTSTLRRACILGSEDGVWQQTTGKCIPITSFSYPQSSFALSKNDPFSITPTVIRDQLSFSIISGSLPIGLSLNSSTGIISGIPSQSVSSQSVTIKAFNDSLFHSLFNSFLHLSTTIKPSSSFKTTPISVQLPIVKEMIYHSPLYLDLFLLVYHSIHQQESYLERLYLQFLSQTSPFKHSIKSDQLNSQSPFKS
ncbi:hypothetical protein JH06_5807 [Blastocystis sp. subtype 4]|uniref:hypothetical protein n=1 Tax=Blastocystis sp. subtype 4 TaxID=944170 RepID=UPI00071168DA|nr:hypothetical protein JH06_5807 [Blastocystis sp. subtype 4]KNB41313.1 hypothetical protein JH06_5807 [Blastocystis sp. subtype 4]|eukprot:XP_014524756.1 hypothetical protein JH06_5807 [Blastocystis sp. subtype 4]